MNGAGPAFTDDLGLWVLTILVLLAFLAACMLRDWRTSGRVSKGGQRVSVPGREAVSDASRPAPLLFDQDAR